MSSDETQHENLKTKQKQQINKDSEIKPIQTKGYSLLPVHTGAVQDHGLRKPLPYIRSFISSSFLCDVIEPETVPGAPAAEELSFQHHHLQLCTLCFCTGGHQPVNTG